jgi:hypothetical protein
LIIIIIFFIVFYYKYCIFFLRKKGKDVYLARKIPHIQITLSLGGEEEYDKVKEEDALAHLSDQIISFK